MMMIDTRTHRSTLTTVLEAAHDQNGWDILAVARTTEPDDRDHDAPMGVCCFAYKSGRGKMYGTAHWNLGLRVSFDFGHFYLTYEEAIADFRRGGWYA